jgi:hypothetical protein
MANPRDFNEMKPVVDAVRAGDLALTASLVTLQNINTSLNREKDTLLILAAALNQTAIVAFLLSNPHLQHDAHRQGIRALNVAIDYFNPKTPASLNTILRILSDEIFYYDNSFEYIDITHPNLAQKMKKIKNNTVMELFILLRQYQAFYFLRNTNYSIKSQMNRMQLTYILAQNFKDLGYPKQEVNWMRIKSSQFIKILKYNLESLAIGLEIDKELLMASMKDLLAAYYAQDDENNFLKITADEAYQCAMTWGLLFFNREELEWAHEFECYLHDAFEIATAANLPLDADEKKFLIAYRASHNKNDLNKQVSNEKRLSKKMDYLLLLENGLELNSEPAGVVMSSQTDFPLKLLSQIISNKVNQQHDYAGLLMADNNEIEGIKYLYGIDRKSDVEKAFSIFASSARYYSKHDGLKALNAHLLSIIAQFQMLVATHDKTEKNNIKRNLVKTYQTMLRFYHGVIPLSYHVEIFASLFDLIKITQDKKAKLIYINFINMYLNKLVKLNPKFRDDLITYVFEAMQQAQLLEQDLYYEAIIRLIEDCMANCDDKSSRKLFFNKLDITDLARQNRRNETTKLAAPEIPVHSNVVEMYGYDINNYSINNPSTLFSNLPRVQPANGVHSTVKGFKHAK